MKLMRITFSDPRENIPVEDIIDLLKMSPKAEVGVQAHPSAMESGKPRFDWFCYLLNNAKLLPGPVNIAIHVNYQWCDEMCTGNIPREISYLLSEKHPKTNKPLISRIQLNIGDNTYKFSAPRLANLISYLPEYEFIFPYNIKTNENIERLANTNAKFKLLFDGSYGAGESPKKWEKPVYDDIKFGYAGGLSATNVCENLDKISAILPQDYETWIDAEGKLRDTTGSCNLELARQYLTNALDWTSKHER